MAYPRVLTEDETIDAALAGKSLSRFGDGELRLAVGGTSISQRERSKALREELCDILKSPPTNCLVCIPRLGPGLNDKQWNKYATRVYTNLYDENRTYGSLHVTRPDSAPHIDRPDYWDKVRQLWAGKSVVLVRGCDRSLVPSHLRSAARTREVMGYRVDSYKIVNQIEAEIGQTDETVILCLGATATVLAARLARRGMHALDLGHAGMFARRRGLWEAGGTDGS